MSKVTYEFCDRCGKKISRELPVVQIRRLKVVMIFGHGINDGVESSYSLCADCTRLFVNFIRAKAGEHCAN